MSKKISIEEMTQEMQEKFTISLEDAHKILLDHGVTKSTNTQVTMRWIRDGKIDALLIGKGRVETRKWLINKESLMEFVAFERLTLGDFKAMKEELEMLRAFKFEVEKKPKRGGRPKKDAATTVSKEEEEKAKA
ncbi:TPA: hypothetical protein ACGPFX_005678 [Bacillus pacificus]